MVLARFGSTIRCRYGLLVASHPKLYLFGLSFLALRGKAVMKSRSMLLGLLLVDLIGLVPSVRAQVPGIINYQGRVTVGGTNFTGIGLFKFALVNGSAGTTNYWSNDGTPVSQPSKAVPVTVSKGLYSVLLGDATISNMSTAIPNLVFSNADVRLRVWFND